MFCTPGEFTDRMTFHPPESSNGTPFQGSCGTLKTDDAADVPLSD
jgi:hypothetical protein